MIMEQIRYAFVSNPDELEEAFNVRREVFVREQSIPEEIEMDEYDGEALQIIVRDGDRVIATARARFPDDNTAKIERMAVLKPHRRRGIGAGIISFLIVEFENRQIGQVILHAQCSAAGFYGSCGFTETGQPFMEAGIEHIKMERRL